MAKRIIKALAAGLAAALISSTVQAESLSIGTSGSGSVFYVNAVGMSRVIQDHADINVSVVSVGGSHPSVFAISNEKVDLAVVNAVSALDGFRAKAPFQKPVDLRLVAQGDLSLRQVLVRRGTDIQTASDLAGARWFTKIPANPDIGDISKALMTAANIDPGSVKQLSASASGDIISAFEAGTIDAATLPASAGAPHVMSLFHNKMVEYLYISPEEHEAMKPLLPEGIRLHTLAAGTYPNQDKDAAVFAMRTLLVASADTPEDLVYRVARALFENGEQLAGYHPTAKHWTVENTLDDFPLPLHPGVVRYLEESGAWTDELASRQAQF